MAFWILIMSKKATKTELEEQYSLDDALKLSALCQMRMDTASAKEEENKRKLEKQGKGG